MNTITSISGLCSTKCLLRLAQHVQCAVVAFSIAGCTPIVPGTDDRAGAHGPVPGLFGADEVWAITSGNFLSGSDQSGPILLMRGYGNTIEYVIASKTIPISQPFETPPDPEAVDTPPDPVPVDTVLEPAPVDTAPEPISLGLEFSTASISLQDRTLTARADFIDLNGRNIQVRLTATVCEEATSSSGPINCELQAPELNLVIDGEAQDAQGVSFQLVRLESCPKSLDIAAPADSQWSITNIPFLALLFATAAGGQPAAQELPFPVLIVAGSGAQAESALDATRFGGDESDGCVTGAEVGDPVPADAVGFNGSSLELNIFMAHVTTTAGETVEGGTCRATFEGSVTYCGVVNGGVFGAEVQRYVLRIDGAGERDRAVDGASQLDHVYMLITPLASPLE